MAIFDELLDFNGNEKFRNLMRYRFFGTNVPDAARLQIFLDYDSRINDDLSDLDKVYLPLLKIQRKIIFEHPKYGSKVISKKKEYIIKWNDAKTMAESMDLIIAGLKRAKRRYSENDARNFGRGRRKVKRKKKRKSGSLFLTDEEQHAEDDENVGQVDDDVIVEANANVADDDEGDGVVDEEDDAENVGQVEDAVDDAIIVEANANVAEDGYGVVEEEDDDDQQQNAVNPPMVCKLCRKFFFFVFFRTIYKQHIDDDDQQQNKQNPVNASMVCSFFLVFYSSK